MKTIKKTLLTVLLITTLFLIRNQNVFGQNVCNDQPPCQCIGTPGEELVTSCHRTGDCPPGQDCQPFDSNNNGKNDSCKCRQITFNIPVTPLYQGDYTDKMDNSDLRIADFGCSLTALTMSINYAINTNGLHSKNPDGTIGNLITYTPADINRLLNEYRYKQNIYKKDANGEYVVKDGKYVVERIEIKNGWSVTIGEDGKPIGSNTSINVGALLKAIENDTRMRSFEGKGLKQESYRSSNDIGPDGVVLDPNYLKILEELEQGRPVPVRVAEDKHSVLITSYHGEQGKQRGSGKYNIKDPASNSIVWLDHENYKNKIYSWNAGVFKAGGLHNPFEVPSDYYIDPILLTDPEINPEYYGLQIFVENHIIISDIIPTLSQWGIIIFTLLLLAVGMVFVQRRQFAVAVVPTGRDICYAPTGDGKLFERSLYIKVLGVVLLFAVTGLALAYWYFGTLSKTDSFGTLASSGIVAYMVHLWLLMRKK